MRMHHRLAEREFPVMLRQIGNSSQINSIILSASDLRSMDLRGFDSFGERLAPIGTQRIRSTSRSGPMKAMLRQSPVEAMFIGPAPRQPEKKDDVA